MWGLPDILIERLFEKRRSNVMKREIARRGRGNFRGVCPTIGRLRRAVPRVYRCGRGSTGRVFCAGLFFGLE